MGDQGENQGKSVWGPHFPLRSHKSCPIQRHKGAISTSFLFLALITSPSAFFVLEK